MQRARSGSARAMVEPHDEGHGRPAFRPRIAGDPRTQVQAAHAVSIPNPMRGVLISVALAVPAWGTIVLAATALWRLVH